MATMFRMHVPKCEFHLSGTGHDIQRVAEAIKEKIRQMERNNIYPDEVVIVEVPAEDDTLGR